MKKPNVSCLKPTSDNWHPNIDGKFCRVYIGQALPLDDAFFVGVTGDDDDIWVCEQTGLMEATIMYMRVTSLEDVTKAVLTKMGFKRS